MFPVMRCTENLWRHSMDYEKAFEEIDKALTELQEENTTTPIIVEGEKDTAALRRLEMTGDIVPFNRGQSVSDFCDQIAQQYRGVILLTDWDWRGGRLCAHIKKHLENRVACNTKYREVFAKHSLCRTVEGLPSWIATLKKKITLE